MKTQIPVWDQIQKKLRTRELSAYIFEVDIGERFICHAPHEPHERIITDNVVVLTEEISNGIQQSYLHIGCYARARGMTFVDTQGIQ